MGEIAQLGISPSILCLKFVFQILGEKWNSTWEIARRKKGQKRKIYQPHPAAADFEICHIESYYPTPRRTTADSKPQGNLNEKKLSGTK